MTSFGKIRESRSSSADKETTIKISATGNDRARVRNKRTWEMSVRFSVPQRRAFV